MGAATWRGMPPGSAGHLFDDRMAAGQAQRQTHRAEEAAINSSPEQLITTAIAWVIGAEQPGHRRRERHDAEAEIACRHGRRTNHEPDAELSSSAPPHRLKQVVINASVPQANRLMPTGPTGNAPSRTTPLARTRNQMLFRRSGPTTHC